MHGARLGCASGRHDGGNLVVAVAHSGLIDLRAQAVVPSALRPDTRMLQA
jgi:hypothetical protein